MKDLRRRFDRFCLTHRTSGIRNLMLVLAIGNLAVYVLTRIDPSHVVYSYLCFSRSAILHGQVWRLFTYVLTDLAESGSGYFMFLALVAMLCYAQFGRMLEDTWGTLRFNLYYLTGVLMTDLAALVFGYGASAGALNLSLFLAVATIAPEARVLLMFFIPIKFKYMALVYLALTALNVVRYLLSFGFLSFAWLMPLVPLANYFLFFGSGISVLFPPSRRTHTPHKPRPKPTAGWASGYQSRTGERPYRHKCTVCGRTDTEYPNLEFRYCSKCNGYYCYCIDHINNHVHIQ